MRILAALAAAAVLAAPAPALACAVCGAGDPTLTTMGSERAFEGRMRAAADVRVGTSAVGVYPDRIALTEERLELGFVYFFSQSFALSIGVPGLVREIEQAGVGETLVSLGDVEVRARDVVYSARKGPYRHEVSFFAGAKAPTAPLQFDPRGEYLPADLQPGCSSIVPLVGATYFLGRGTWALFASASLYTPFSIRSGPHSGDSFRTAMSAQAQPLPWLATRVGISTKLDEPGQLDGHADPNSGGLVGYVSSELVASPASDVLVSAGVFVPAVQALRGAHQEGTIVQAGLTIDF